MGSLHIVPAPRQIARSRYIEALREKEYRQLRGKTYLDHGGTTLYADSLLEEIRVDLRDNLYGNPHSASSPSIHTSRRIESIRLRALQFMKADPDEFDLVFTANATAGIKLLLECLQGHANAENVSLWYGYHKDAHTSVVGAREMADTHHCFMSDQEVEEWIVCGGIPDDAGGRSVRLFAFPGQSNMTGRRLPLEWSDKIRTVSRDRPCLTLMDAAGLASTTGLDLSDPYASPDFTTLSFYKIFGLPDLGALVVRKRSSAMMENRRYFGGGTVDMVINKGDAWHAAKRDSVHDYLEDGTLPFHSIIALDHAMSVHERLYGPDPMRFISMHTTQLGAQLHRLLTQMRHSNGAAVIRTYGDDSVYGCSKKQGAVVALNVLRADRTFVGSSDVERDANAWDIYIRSGSLCNPGGVATYLEWASEDMRLAYADGHRCSNPVQFALGKPTGVVRVSLGAMSTRSDVDRFLQFIRQTYVQ